MSRSHKKVPLIKGPIHRSGGRKKEKNYDARKIRRLFNRVDGEETFLPDHEVYRKYVSIPWYYKYSDMTLHWRYEKRWMERYFKEGFYEDMSEEEFKRKLRIQEIRIRRK